MSDPPNVLLVILDSVRAKNTSIHEYDRNTTPFLKNFKDNSTHYRQARSPGTDSITSHVSMFTNMHVEEHEAVENTARIDINKTIWRELADTYGYKTGLFTPNPVISDASNLGEAFQTTKTAKFSPLRYKDEVLFENAYYPDDPSLSKQEHIAKCFNDTNTVRSLLNCSSAYTFPRFEQIINRYLEEEYRKLPGDKYISAFLNWQKERQQPWAACINLLDAHVPYDPLDEYDIWSEGSYEKNTREILEDHRWNELEETMDYYDAAILQLDNFMEDLIGELQRRNNLDDTLVIITSDHGLGFGEESLLYPELRIVRKKWGLHEVLTHVPLLVNYPGQKSSETVDSVVTLTNIPKLIHSVINHSDDDPLVNDGFAISSTRRLSEEKNSYGYVEFVKKCYGPWKAVYENDESVKKYMIRRGDGIVARVPDAHTAVVTDDDPFKTTKRYFSKMDSGDIRQGTSDISNELAEHLRHLGYSE